MNNFTKLCKDLEHFETPEWPVRAILAKELMPYFIIDPCCGAGVLTNIARENDRHLVCPIDVHDWGFKPYVVADYLTLSRATIPFPMGEDWTSDFAVIMNPPFSNACEFVEKSFELGARKVVCFQRFAWWESKKRREFWKKNPPSRVYICGDRAPCWRHDIPRDQRNSSSPTAHAWFVFEKGYNGGTSLHHIWKGDLS